MYLYAICLLWASYILKVFNTLLTRSTKAIAFRHVLKTHRRWPACYYNKIIGWWWALNDLWHFDIQKIQGHLAIIHVYRSMTVNLTFDLPADIKIHRVHSFLISIYLIVEHEFVNEKKRRKSKVKTLKLQRNVWEIIIHLNNAIINLFSSWNANTWTYNHVNHWLSLYLSTCKNIVLC